MTLTEGPTLIKTFQNYLHKFNEPVQFYKKILRGFKSLPLIVVITSIRLIHTQSVNRLAVYCLHII
jgi:hypothetical protein